MERRPYKVCKCCGFETYRMLKRKCPTCGVPALWDKRKETKAQVEARIEKSNRFEALLDELLSA